MNAVLNVQIPRRVWVEMYDAQEADAGDVIVQMEDGAYYTAMFCTLPYLARQMDLTHAVSQMQPDVPPTRFAALEMPHVLVETLDRETIEDTLDNLLAFDTFSSVFTRVTDEQGDEAPYVAPPASKRATAEVAAVVMTQVLMIDPVG